MSDFDDGYNAGYERGCYEFLAEIERLRAEVEALRAFAKEVMETWPDGGVDGDDLQESAIKHGMLEPLTRTQPCGEFCACAEYYAADEWAGGITCYRRTALLTGAARGKA